MLLKNTSIYHPLKQDNVKKTEHLCFLFSLWTDRAHSPQHSLLKPGYIPFSSSTVPSFPLCCSSHCSVLCSFLLRTISAQCLTCRGNLGHWLYSYKNSEFLIAVFSPPSKVLLTQEWTPPLLFHCWQMQETHLCCVVKHCHSTIKTLCFMA